MRPIADRFMSRVKKTESCWLWTGGRIPNGYGRTKFSASEPAKLAHRLSYEMFVGDPGGLMVLHHCDVPACVRPDHLFLGTALDNSRDMDLKGRRGRKGSARANQSRSPVAAEFDRLMTECGLANRELARSLRINEKTVRLWRLGEKTFPAHVLPLLPIAIRRRMLTHIERLAAT